MTLAVILNSGTGSRMGELTDNKPKCMVEIAANETVISRQVKALQASGITEILITTGPFAEKLKNYLADSFKELNFTYINNPRYRDTNYIYSLLLAGETILEKLSRSGSGQGEDKKMVMLHGDLVFDRAVVDQLLNANQKDAVLTNPYVSLPEKDFKAEIKNGRVKRIGVDLFSNASVFLIPFYRLSRETFGAWLKEMKRFEEENRLKVYAEDALNNLLEELPLYPVELKDEFCTEIDDKNDFAVVKKYLEEGRQENR
ncbi:MAG: NTP transferase domain-containing protein [Bacillota bacterium]